MTMPQTLILVRHGQSEANIIQKTDPSERELTTEQLMTYPDRSWRLTEKGRHQAEAIGEWLRAHSNPNQKRFVSPYKRTMETAALMNLDTTIHEWETKRLLRERSWGEIDSIPIEQFKEQYPRNYAYKKRDPLYWTPPAGESIAAVADNRVQDIFTELHRDYSEREVLMVTHHDLILATRLKLEHITDEEFTEWFNDDVLDVPNCSAIIYSRIDPVSGYEAAKINWYRIATPIEIANGQYHVTVTEWRTINRKRYNNQQLLNSLK